MCSIQLMSSSNIRTLAWVFVIQLTFDRVQISFQLNFYLFTVIATAAIFFIKTTPDIFNLGMFLNVFLVKWIFLSRFRILIKMLGISHAILALFHHFCYSKWIEIVWKVQKLAPHSVNSINVHAVIWYSTKDAF